MHAFVLRMPKGADLHNHLSGAVYAESYLDRAAKEGLCVTQSFGLKFAVNGHCVLDQSSGANLPADEKLWNEMIDSLSMRGFVPTTTETGADHFFDTFGKFGAASHGDDEDSLALVVDRAARQNESYLELMAVGASDTISQMGDTAGLDENNFDATRQKLLDAGITAQVHEVAEQVRSMNEKRTDLCRSSPGLPACSVMVHYQYQVKRNSAKARVFAETLAGFMLAGMEPSVVAVNYVQREDGYNSLHDYELHMRIVGYMRKLYPKVHVSLHAGELAEGMVPPEDLRFHIREAILTAGAERIGHGVDIMDEFDSLETLCYMREHHIDVEINLTSNDVILGVKGDHHPFPVYRKYGVPVTISTDDEGVSRSDLTMEYERAILTYNLGYPEVKQLVRNSIEYSFTTPEEKAHLKADLEKRFSGFEKWATENFR